MSAAAAPGPAGRRRRAVAGLLELRHVPRLRAPRRGLPRRRRARRRAWSARREAADPAHGHAPRGQPGGRRAQGARRAPRRRPRREPRQGRRARSLVVDHAPGSRRCATDRRPPRPIRPSEVGVDRVLVGAVLALAAFGVVMVYLGGRGVRRQEVRRRRPTSSSASSSTRCWAWARCRSRRASTTRIYRKLAYPLLFVSLGAAGGRAEVRLARGRRHPLVPPRAAVVPAQRAGQVRAVRLPGVPAGAQGREGARCSRSGSCRRCW